MLELLRFLGSIFSSESDIKLSENTQTHTEGTFLDNEIHTRIDDI